MLLEQQADLEFAQPVLVTHRVRPGGLERQPVGAVACDIPRRMQNLLGGNRHEDAVGLLPRVLAVEPAHELGAAQVREDQTLAQPQRGAPEHLHLVLLASQRRPQVPEVGQAFDLLLRHENQDLGERRLPLEDRLRRAAAQHDGALAKPQADGPFDGGDHLLHGLLQRGLVLHLPRPLLASGAPHRSDRRQQGEARSNHACHSIPLPTAAPTTRATSWPPTTMPWFSSSRRSSWSSSARLSASGGNGREWAATGGTVSVTSPAPLPPVAAACRPLPPSIFSISAPIRSSIGKISAIRSSAGSCRGCCSCVRPRRIMASTLRRSRIRRSSSGETRAVACAWAQASSSTSMALSGRARSGTNRSVRTIAALSASSVIATAWCRSSRGRRATRISHV